jgi:hypothetical protein
MGLATAEEFFRDLDLVREKRFAVSPNGSATRRRSKDARVPRSFIKGVLVGVLLSLAVWLALFFLM